MEISDIISILEDMAPKQFAMEWDNSGLLIGRMEKQVKKILVAVDVDDDAVEQAMEQHADLIVSHHPLLFRAIKTITDQDFIGKRILKLLSHDIACYAIHTNYDVCRMGTLAAERLRLTECSPLEITGEKDGQNVGIGIIGDLEEKISFEMLAERIRHQFGVEGLRCFGKPETVKRVAVCPGSGSSVVEEAIKKHAEILVTGDIGHHTGIDANAQGLAVIDAGHYGLEHIFLDDIRHYLQNRIGKEISIVSMPEKWPFSIV